MKICTIDKCQKAVYRKGWCQMHYTRWYKHGDPYKTLRRSYSKGAVCSLDGCSNRPKARGMCADHYRRWNNHGDPLAGGMPNPASRDELVGSRSEWVGECLVWFGSKDSYGYAMMRFETKEIGKRVHRYVWEKSKGAIPEGMVIDHKCFNTSCINLDHLRLASVKENARNRSGPSVNNTSGYRNVVRHQGLWRVLVMRDGKRHCFGSYEDVDEAGKSAEDVRNSLFGEFAGNG